MTGVVHKLRPALRRAIVLRQLEGGHWKVEGYEQQGSAWRFTWLLNPAEPEPCARQYAAKLAQHTGLPLAEQRLGDRVRLIGGVLGRAA
jgi:hypothetical protein